MLQRRAPWAPYLAEALGTFALVFFGAGAIAVDATSGGAVSGVGIGIAFGLIVTAMILTLGHVSGCHINPAITIGFLALRRIELPRAAGYIVAQLIGAILAATAVVAIVGDAGDAGATAPRIGGTDAAFWSEIILTFFLALVVFAVATDERAERPFAAVAIGGYVGLAATAWGPIANASMNPARSFGPSLRTGVWDAHWVYWVAPLLAVLLAAAVYEVLRAPKDTARIDAGERASERK